MVRTRRGASSVGVSSGADSLVLPDSDYDESSAAPIKAKKAGSKAKRKYSKKRSFGDHMSEEGDTSSISTIVLIYYAALTVYGAVIVYVAGARVWEPLLYYALAMVAFYAWHSMAHASWTTWGMHQEHMFHHLKAFPPGNFYGKPGLMKEWYGKDVPTLLDLMDPRGTTVGSFAHEGPLFIMNALIFIFGYYVLGTNIATLAFVLLEYIAIGVVGTAIHISFHVRDFELEKYQWYLSLRSLHYIHHLGDMKSNLGMVNMEVLDGIFGSLALTDPVAKRMAAKEGPAETFVDAVSSSDLPPGVTRELLEHAKAAAGVSAGLLGFDVPLGVKAPPVTNAINRGYPTVALRLVLTAVALTAWYLTESALKDSVVHAGSTDSWAAQATAIEVVDRGHIFLAGLREWLIASEWVTTACAISQALSEVTVVVLMLGSICGRTFRPALSMIVVMMARVAMHSVTAVPFSDDHAWAVPDGFPHFFVTPDTMMQFFSMKVALALVAAVELNRWAVESRKTDTIVRLCTVAGLAFVAYDVVLSLALELAWSFDVIISLIVARYATMAAARLSFLVDVIMP